MLNAISASALLIAALAVLFNWTQTQFDALWFYINCLVIAACALGAVALWRGARARPVMRQTSGALAVLAAAVAIQAALVEPLLRPLSLVIWEVVNFITVIALPFAAGLLMRRA